MTALSLLDPGGERLLEVFVLLECHRCTHLGGQNHFGPGGERARKGAHSDLLGAGGGHGGSGGSTNGPRLLLLQALLQSKPKGLMVTAVGTCRVVHRKAQKGQVEKRHTDYALVNKKKTTATNP